MNVLEYDHSEIRNNCYIVSLSCANGGWEKYRFAIPVIGELPNHDYLNIMIMSHVVNNINTSMSDENKWEGIVNLPPCDDDHLVMIDDF